MVKERRRRKEEGRRKERREGKEGRGKRKRKPLHVNVYMSLIILFYKKGGRGLFG